MSFGPTLKKAREAKGLTCSQVAAQTRILVQIITDMENEDFHRIPAPIYGRGFVRLYAECVDLDPIPLIREFMDIYEGRRAPNTPDEPPPPPPPPPIPVPPPEPIAPIPEPVFPSAPPPAFTPAPAPSFETPFAPPPEPVPPAPDETPAPAATSPVPEPPPVVTAPVFTAQPAPQPAPPPVAPQPASVPPPVVPESLRGLDLFDRSSASAAPAGGAPRTAPQPNYEGSPFIPSYSETEERSAVERFRESLTDVSSSIIQRVSGIPRSAWRIALLCLGALAVVVLLVYVCIKLYQATTPAAQPAAPQPPPVAEAPAKHAAATPQKPGQATASTRQTRPGRLRATGQNVTPLYVD